MSARKEILDRLRRRQGVGTESGELASFYQNVWTIAPGPPDVWRMSDMEIVNNYLLERARKKKPYSIVVVAEGIEKPSGDQSAASYVAKKIEEGTGIETRKTILGDIQRGGSPSPMDRILATRFGAYAVDLIANEDYGKMVIKKGEKIKDILLSDVGSNLRLVPEDHKLIQKARGLDICFGG